MLSLLFNVIYEHGSQYDTELFLYEIGQSCGSIPELVGMIGSIIQRAIAKGDMEPGLYECYRDGLSSSDDSPMTLGIALADSLSSVPDGVSVGELQQVYREILTNDGAAVIPDILAIFLEYAAVSEIPFGKKSRTIMASPGFKGMQSGDIGRINEVLNTIQHREYREFLWSLSFAIPDQPLRMPVDMNSGRRRLYGSGYVRSYEETIFRRSVLPEVSIKSSSLQSVIETAQSFESRHSESLSKLGLCISIGQSIVTDDGEPVLIRNYDPHDNELINYSRFSS